MKKIVLLVASIFAIGSAIAGGDQTNALVGIQKKKEITHGGFYLHLGLAIPNFKTKFAKDGESKSLGVQPSLELGHNFMFYKTDQIGIGMNVSWFTFGLSSIKSSYKLRNETEYRKTSSVYLSFLKLGPMATYALNDKMAIDAFFDFSPTVYFGTESYSYSTSIKSSSNAFVLSGVTLSPGAKFRYKKLCVGVEIQFGKLAYVNTDNSALNSKADYFAPRAMLGFKF
jgi:hypothetical protein